MEGASASTDDHDAEQEAQSQTQAQAVVPAAHRYKYDVGDAVILHGLVRSPHVNGRRAIVHFYNHNPNHTAADDDRRCLVRLLSEPSRSNNTNTRREPHGCISVMGKNLTLDYLPGQKVMLHDLMCAKHLNGRTATVVRFHHGGGGNGGVGSGTFVVEVPIFDDDEAANDEADIDDEAKMGKEEKNEDHNNTASQIWESNQLAPEECHNKSNDVELGDKDSVTTAVKQMRVSPRNMNHLPGTRPPPVTPLDQRLLFTGTMASIVKILNQSVHKAPDPMQGTILNHTRSTRYMRGFNLLSDSMESEQHNDAHRRMMEMGDTTRLWRKIEQGSYKSRSDSSAVEDQDQDDRGSTQLPPFYQRLVHAPSNGRMHRVCFNPNCHRHILPGSTQQQRMKRCTKCRSVAYCNRQCATEAWGHHRKVCRVIQTEDVQFADYVALTSPHREVVMEAQRMVRKCVSRIAKLDDPSRHFEQIMGPDDQAETTGKLLYDVITQGGTDITNEVLLHLENPPPPGREVTVAVGFNSLGDAIFSRKDIQLFANIYDCKVTYQVLNSLPDGKEEEEDIALEPNGEEVHRPTTINFGNDQLPEDVQEGLANFINNIVPGMMPPGMNAPDDANANVDGGNNDNAGAGADDNGAAAVGDGGGEAGQMPPGLPAGLANFLNHVMNNAGVDVGNANGGDNMMPGMMPPGMNAPDDANANVDGGNNDNAGAGADNGAAAVGEAGQMPPGLPAGLNNFLYHVMNNAGVDVGNANGGDNDNDSLPSLDSDGNGADENEPAGEAGGGEGNAEGQQQGAGAGAGGAFPFPGMANNGNGGLHFNIPGVEGGMMGGAQVHVHMADVMGVPPEVQAAVMHAGAGVFPMHPGDGDGNGGPNPPGAFQQIPGLPEGVHVFHGVLPQGDMPPMGGLPEEVAAMMQAGAFAMPLDGILPHPVAEDREVEEETEMEIED